MTRAEGEGRTERRPRRRGRWRWLLWPLLLVALLLFLVQSDVVARFLARTLEEVLEAATGEQVTIGRVHLGYLPLHADVQGLVITHPSTGDTIAAVGAIRLDPGLEGWRPVLRRVQVDGPQVSLHVDPDGLREFRGIPASSGGGTPLRELPWKELVIHGGSFDVQAPDGSVDVQGIEVTPADAGALDLAIHRVQVQAGTIEQTASDLKFRGILLTPDSVAVPSIDVAFEALRIDGSLALAKDGPLSGDVSLGVDLGRLTAPDVPGTQYVEGAVSVDVALAGVSTAPEVGGSVSTSGLVVWRESDTGLVATRIGDAVGSWRFVPGAPDKVAVGPLTMSWGEGTLRVDAEVVPSTKGISGTVTAEGVHLARILQSVGVAPTPWVDLTGDVEAHVDGTIAPFRLDGPFEVNVASFYVDDGPIDARSGRILTVPRGTVVGRLGLDLSHLVLDGAVRAGPSHGHARADIGLESWGPLGVDVDFPALDLSQLRPLGDAELGGIAKVNGWIGGRFDEPMGAWADIAVDGAVALGLPIADHLAARLDSDLVRIHLGGIRATLGESPWQGDFTLAFTDPMFVDTQVYVNGGHIHDLAGIFLDVGPMDGKVSGTAVLSGEPYHLEGDVALDLRDVDLYGEHFPEGHATAWMDDGEFTLEELLLRRDAETVLARGSVKRGFALNMELLADGLSLPRLDHLAGLGLPLEGALALDAQVGGTLFEPEPRGRIAATRTYYDGRALADSAISFSTAAGVLSWNGDALGDALHTRGTLALFGDQAYESENRLSGFPLHLFYPRGADGTPVEARVSGDVSLAGRFGDSPTPVDLEGRLDRVTADWSGHRLRAPDPWVFAVHGTSVQVPRLRLVGDDGTSLGFEGFTTARGHLSFRGGGDVNLDLARAFVPELEMATGLAQVEVTVERDGEGDPRVEVGAKIDDADVRTGYFPADFEGLTATIEARPDRYLIRDLRAEVGGGVFRSGESRIDAEDWLPKRFQLEGDLTDARVQYLDYLPPMVGDAHLKFDGPTDDLLLSGSIDIDDMEFRDRIDWEGMVLSLREERLTGSAPEEGERYFSMDLDVKAPDTIRLRNNVADAEATAKLRIVGDTARPGMVGEVIVDPGGSVYLHEREFEVSRGELRFVDPYTYDPDLDILLETDVRSHEQDYHIGYGVSGPFSDWRTTTTSDPYLAQADVNALLLFGVTREELERYGGLGTALFAETGDLLLAQTAISRTNLFFDRWNLVSGVSERGSNTVTSDLRLVAEKQIEDFDVTVEKRLDANIGRYWYASVERRLAERLYATAYVATQQEGRSLPIGAAYGVEFKLKWELD